MTFSCRLESSIKSYECFMFLLNFRLKISAPPPQPHPRGYCENKGWRGYSSGSVYTVFSIFTIFSFFTLWRLEGLLEELTPYFLCFNPSLEGGGGLVYCLFFCIFSYFHCFYSLGGNGKVQTHLLFSMFSLWEWGRGRSYSKSRCFHSWVK